MRAWLTGKQECEVTAREIGSEHLDTCLPSNDAHVWATLRGKATQEKKAEVRSVFERAAKCFDDAPKVVQETCSPACAPRSNQGKDYEAVRKCFADKRRALEQVVATYSADDADFAAAKTADAAEAWFRFIAKHPQHSYASYATRRVLEIAADSKGDEQFAIDERFVTAFPSRAADLPAERRVLLVGPLGLRVRDLRRMTEANLAPSVIVARVRASREPYKNFSADELVVLKELGLSDEIVTAMIEVTTKLDERQRADDDRKALHAEMATLKAMIAEKKAEVPAGKTGEIVQTKEGPLDLLASCAKRLGAMKLCEHIPFPGSNICASAAESSFPCPK